MTTPVYVHGFTDAGPRRKHNEDAFRVERLGEDDVLIVVCDGMGGHADGEVASAVAADRLVALLRTVPAAEVKSGFVPAFASAHQAVRGISLDGSPGTTAVVVRVIGPHAWYAWVGDSRLYVVRQGEVQPISVDHTRAQELIAGGALTPAEASRTPHANALTRVLGGLSAEPAEPGIGAEPLLLAPGDAILVCSDGLSKMMTDAEMGPQAAGRDYREATERLVRDALDRGGFDNVTVVIAVSAQAELNGERVHGRLKTMAAAAPALAPSFITGGSVDTGNRTGRRVIAGIVVLAVLGFAITAAAMAVIVWFNLG